MIFCTAIEAQKEINSEYEYNGNTRINKKTNIIAAMYNISSNIYSGTPEQIAKQFLEENKTAFGISDIADMKYTEIIESPAGKHVGFLQTYKGIPVFGSETVISINKENKVSMAVNGNTRITGLKSTTSGISKDFAVSKAITKVNAEEKTLVMQPKTELYIFQDSSGNSTLTWKINFTAQNPRGDWQVFVDANSGEIIKVMDILMYSVNGTGRVFKPDPITALNNTNLNDNSDYNALRDAYVTVTLNNLNDAIGGVYRLQGAYARSEEIASPNITPVTSATTSFLYTRDQPGFQETNAYYFIDLQRQYIGGLGFYPQWNNQNYIRFDAHGTDEWNAWYNSSGQYLIFGDGGIDAAEDQDVIIHEYTHALHDAFMTGSGYANLTDESAVSEGSGDYLAISYRRTLSSFQPDKEAPWFGSGRSLSIYLYYPSNWNPQTYPGQYIAGTLWASTMMDIETSSGIGRDVATKLLLTSFSYVTSSSSVMDHVNAILQADRDIYNGWHLSTLAAVFNNRYFLYYNQVSGNINSNTTWSGIKYVTGNVTVNNGATLTISPGTFIFFSSGSSLTINNGALSANGNSSSTPIIFDFISPNSSTQNGIIFNSGSSGTINYCQIRNAYCGIFENNTSINITYSSISGCTNGIYLHNSSPTIQKCNIHNNSSYGINMMYSSFSPSAVLIENYINNNDCGVYCSTNSTPIFGTGSNVNGNNISSNNYGIRCYDNANPNIGNGTNSGYNNLVNTTYNVYNMTNNTISAINNWWGTTDPAYFKTYGNISYIPYRTTPATFYMPPLSKTNGNIAENSSKDIQMLSELNKAYQLVESKNLAEARTICLNLVNNYPDLSVSYNALNLLKDTYTDNELTSKQEIYKTLFSNKSKKDLYAMAGLILSAIDKENKLKHINEVISNYKGETVVELALFDKFVYYYFELNNKEMARTILKELDAQFPNSNGSIEAHKILGDKEYIGLYADNLNLKKTTTNTAPKDYTLYDNYPNPFNPSTTISYSIPEDGKVVVKVFDVLGRELATLVNDVISAGAHSVLWNGNNFASGIYFYNVTYKNQTLYKKMLLVK
jgi:zinc metalloprotease ZmpB